MDSQFCAPLHATDLMITPYPVSPDDVCAANILPWIILLIPCFVLNLWIALQRHKLHLRRKGKRVIPWMVILSYAGSLGVLLYLILPFVGVSAANGGTAVLLGCEFLIFNTKCLLMLRKLVRLGTRIIPISHKVMLDSPSSSAKREDSNVASTDAILKFMMTLGSVLSATQVVIMVILVFARSDMITLWFTLGFALEEAVLVLVIFSTFYQLQRCVAAIQRTVAGSSSSNGRPLNSTQSSQLHKAIRRMRSQQLVVAINCLPNLTVYSLIVASVIPRHYAVVLGILYGDALANFGLLLPMIRKRGGTRNSAKDEAVVANDGNMALVSAGTTNTQVGGPISEPRQDQPIE